MGKHDSLVGDEVRTAFNGALTDTLNSQTWLVEWQEAAMRALAEEVRKVRGRRHFFYLKGGRAMALLLKGELERDSPVKEAVKAFIASVNSDWDTQIVIDPGLAPRRWYELYRELHDLVLAELCKAQASFTKALGRQKEAPRPLGKDSMDVSQAVSDGRAYLGKVVELALAALEEEERD